MNKTCVLLFSFNRPLQLDLCLRSFFYHCKDYNSICNDIDIKVLYKASDDRFEEAYDKLEKEYEDNVIFILERNFKRDLLDALDGYDRVLWLVDDNVFIKDFYLQEVDDLLSTDDEAIGFSFRLGSNTNYCYSMNSNQRIPVWIDFFSGKYQRIYEYLWPVSDFDFAYPLELSSSFYRVCDIIDILKKADYHNPNDVEWQFYLKLYEYAKPFPYLLCYDQSVAFCAPMNKVQKVNNNRYVMAPGYMIDDLLFAFETGRRVDVKQFDGFVPKSCHQEYFFL